MIVYLLKWIAVLGAIGLFLVIFFVIVVPVSLTNWNYAPTVFKNLEYSEVLASRRMIAFPSDYPWDNCAYAVVGLPEDAPNYLGDLPNINANGGLLNITGWLKTPGQLDSGETRYSHWCEPSFSWHLFRRMKAAMEDTGGWYVVDGYVEIVYSPRHKIAYHIMPSY
jgi:hypothetical protein